MDTPSFLIAYPLYCLFEGLHRIGVFFFCAGYQSATWCLLKPSLSMILSPGYWLASNCKEMGSRGYRARLIVNYNHWILYLSILIFVLVVAVQEQGYELLKITVAFLAWRFVSRSTEIAIAFWKDIISTENISELTNTERLKLAFWSYVEIFFFSAAFYAADSCEFVGLSKSMLASLYVGTMTNVPEVANGLTYPHMVFLQVFSTLSLIVLSIAGYLAKTKSETK